MTAFVPLFLRVYNFINAVQPTSYLSLLDFIIHIYSLPDQFYLINLAHMALIAFGWVSKRPLSKAKKDKKKFQKVKKSMQKNLIKFVRFIKYIFIKSILPTVCVRMYSHSNCGLAYTGGPFNLFVWRGAPQALSICMQYIEWQRPICAA